MIKDSTNIYMGQDKDTYPNTKGHVIVLLSKY